MGTFDTAYAIYVTKQTNVFKRVPLNTKVVTLFCSQMQSMLHNTSLSDGGVDIKSAPVSYDNYTF